MVKALIVGTGGIGARHAANILALRPGAVLIGVRTEPTETTTRLGMKLVPDLAAGIGERPDFAVVALPPALHGKTAGTLLAARVPVYLEKPPAVRVADLESAAHAAESKGIVTMTGCVLRHMPGFQRLRDLVREEVLGPPIHARLSVGQWLPDWRPGRDYRDTYSAQRALGGGVLLDLIHEIDLARFLFGEFETVRAVACSSGTLEIDTEDTADILLCRSGLTVNVHLDYLDRARQREGRVILSGGTVSYDVMDGRVAAYSAETGRWREIAGKDDFSTRQALTDAMAHFIDCVSQRAPCEQPISDGLRSLALVEQARSGAGLLA